MSIMNRPRPASTAARAEQRPRGVPAAAL